SRTHNLGWSSRSLLSGGIWVLLSRALPAAGLGQRRKVFEHVLDVAAQPGEGVHLPVELAQPVLEQRTGMPARAHALLADLHELADLVEAQAEPLGALDEAHVVDGFVV